MAAFDDDPTEMIIGSAFVITATTVIRKLAEGSADKGAGNKWTPVIYGFLLALALLAIATVSAGFARGLAMMGLVGAFVVNGPTIFELVGKLGK